MRKLPGNIASLLHDMRPMATYLIGGYWILIILFIAYWVLTPN